MPASEIPTEKPRPHAVVIGAGFGGLAAAVRLGAKAMGLPS
jgi:cation diffusion facilitator CzcD-associated flavoprotein CzcO